MRLFFIVILVAITGCQDGKLPPVQPVEEHQRPVKVHHIVSIAGSKNYEFAGRIQAAHSMDLSFEVGGVIAQLDILEGQSLKKGQLIASLNPRNYQLLVQEATEQQRIALRNLTRIKKLQALSSASQSTLDTTQSTATLSKIAVEKAAKNLADTKLYAPFDAVVAKRHTEAHVNVSPGDPIVKLNNSSYLRVETNIPANLVATRNKSEAVDVYLTFDFAPSQKFPLEYLENAAESNAIAQTYKTFFKLATSNALNLLPGMTGNVHLSLNKKNRPLVRIPIAALRSNSDNEFYIWQLNTETNTVHQHLVRVDSVSNDSGFANILGNDLHDTYVIAAGASQMREGMQVRVLNDASIP